MKNFIRKLIQKIGLDLHRYKPVSDKFSYLKKLGLSTVLDVGANTGQFAKEIRKKLPEVMIYSFEPLTECFEQLNENMRDDKNFQSFNFALGDEDKIIEMNKSEYSPSSSILKMSENHKTLFPHTEKHTREKISIKKLDDLTIFSSINNNILIKVDVQGFEKKVIIGGEKTFKKARVILIENSFVKLYDGQPLFDEIYEILKNLGFSYKGSLQEKINRQTGEIISEDSIFIKI